MILNMNLEYGRFTGDAYKTMQIILDCDRVITNIIKITLLGHRLQIYKE